jgi:opacity protein-like surface antigen
MRHSKFPYLAVAFVILSPLAAQAQDDKPVHVTFGGGYTGVGGEAGDRLGGGYNINFGVDVKITPVLSIEGLYSFNGLGEKRISIPVSPVVNPLAGETVDTDFFSTMNMQYGTASLIAAKPEGTVRPYGLVGMGVYYRPAKVTTPGVGFAPGYCDPWFYVCYPGGWVEVDKIVGDRSSTDFGMAFGGGVRFGPAYAELRYHYIWGPEVESLTTVNPLATSDYASLVGKKANGQFLVTTFGVRF